jgi:hypothetical protein
VLDTEQPTNLPPYTSTDAPSPLSPLEAVRAECLSCCNGSAQEVRECTAKACPLWSLRFGHRLPDAPRSTVGVIREKCLDCSGGSRAEVRSCPFLNKCALHPFRFGKNPNRSAKPREGSA